MWGLDAPAGRGARDEVDSIAHVVPISVKQLSPPPEPLLVSVRQLFSSLEPAQVPLSLSLSFPPRMGTTASQK